MAGMLSFFTLQGVEGCTFASWRGEIDAAIKVSFCFSRCARMRFFRPLPRVAGKNGAHFA